MGRRRKRLSLGLFKPPLISDALVWLDGTVLGSEFVDKSGNGRDFLITDKDFTTDYLPYKTAATISAPVGDATLIAADINNFLYDSGGTPNQIPVVSLFQNIDYEDKLFCKHVAQKLDGNGVEIQEPYVKDIVLYNTVLSGDDLTKANNYYVVDDKDVDSKWTAKIGDDTTGNGTEILPYLTLSKSNLAVGVGNTIYGKTGIYNELQIQSSLYLFKEMNLKGLGITEITSLSTGRVVYSDAGINPQTFKHIIVDGESNTSNGFELNAISTNKNLDKVLVKNATSYAVITESGGSDVSIINSVFLAQSNQVRVVGDSIVSSNLFDGATGIGIRAISSIDTDTFEFNNNKFNLVSTVADIYISTSGIFTIKGNKFTPVNSKYSMYMPNSVNTMTLNFSHNTIEGYTSTEIIKISPLNIVDDIIISNNDIDLTTSMGNVSVINIPNQDRVNILNNVFRCFSTSVVSFVDISSDGGSSDSPNVSNNLFNHNKNGGYCILLGDEGDGSWTGKLDNSLIEKNKVYGSYYNSGSVIANCHEIMINDQPIFTTRYNNINGGGIGFITKGESIVTDGVCSYNVFENCRRPIYINGIQGSKIYNNLIINKDASSSEGITMLINGTTGATNTVIKNNIIILSSNIMISTDADSDSGLDSDYNIFYVIGGGSPSFVAGGITKTFVEWQALGNDVNSIVLTTQQYNNLFTDVDNGDYSLKAGSQAIGNGIDLGVAYDDGLDASTNWGDETTLPTVVTKQQGANWDIGAYIS